MSALEVTGAVLVLVGTAVLAVAAVGLFRLPDPYARTMCLTLASSLALPAMVVGAWCFHPGGWNAVKVVVVLVLLPYTSSVGSTVLNRAGYLRGASLEPAFDDLAPHRAPDGSAHDVRPPAEGPGPRDLQ
ncbi:monovalent cation/H(+) antiporter subunit G [Georgenia sp. 10Sc9-8]|uniref:Monovalent cation/H(+) antiporter subunit G n=1 Tax=Georgenia halotolerans TaxID=3028317 RepID=A0ABT5U438_9MICO|nr:monovalent cation/H(+) antiporter subunit G [Georgenia halotolerans]